MIKESIPKAAQVADLLVELGQHWFGSLEQEDMAF